MTRLLLLNLWLPLSLASTYSLDKLCELHDAVDCNLVKAVAWRESGNRNITKMDNKSLSYGPLQVKCDTAKMTVLRENLRYGCEQLEAPKVSIRFGIYYLNYQIERYKGDLEAATAAYNSGTIIVCKRYNPGTCYPGEYYNHRYVDAVMRRYRWLKSMKRDQVRVSSNASRSTDGFVTYQTRFKSEYQTPLEDTKGFCLVLK